MELYDRRVVITADTIQMKDLRVTLDVSKNLKPTEPNKATIKIYNLNPSHRSQLETLQVVPVQIEAGYKAGTSVIFLGDLRSATTLKEGNDLVTTLTSGDKEQAHQTSRVSQSFAKGSSPTQVLNALAKALGVSPGNVAQAAGKIRGEFGNVFSMGTVLSGSAVTEMNRVCKALDLEWSVQGGKLQILSRKEALQGTAILLSKDTGMIGEPTVGIDSKDKRPIMTCKSLIQPDVFPGRLLVVKGVRVSGQYRIESTHHVGDTHGEGEAWIVEIAGKKY